MRLMSEEDIAQSANNNEGEGTTPTEEPTVEPTTDESSEPVREDSNRSTTKPETVPYDTFAEERRANRELKQRLASFELLNKAPFPTSTEQQGETVVPEEFINDDGTVNIEGYTGWMRSQIPDPKAISQEVLTAIDRRDTLRDMKSKEEANLQTKYPNIDSETRKFVEAVKNQSLLEGTYKSLTEAADEVFNITKQVANTTKQQVTEDRQIHANMAGVSTPSAKINVEAQEDTRLRELMQDTNPRVRDSARVEWLKRQLK